MTHAHSLVCSGRSFTMIGEQSQPGSTECVTRHTSHVTRHTSQVTRHTSHLTPHTSHVTRHTSHVTRLSSGNEFDLQRLDRENAALQKVCSAVVCLALHTSHVTRHTLQVAPSDSLLTRGISLLLSETGASSSPQFKRRRCPGRAGVVCRVTCDE